MGNFYQDFYRGIGLMVDRYYPEFLIPEAQLMFDTTVISVGTRTITDVTAIMVEDKKLARTLIAAEYTLGGIAEIMAYYRYCNAKSARRQHQSNTNNSRYANAQDADYREV